jgi:hypothetical protein
MDILPSHSPYNARRNHFAKHFLKTAQLHPQNRSSKGVGAILSVAGVLPNRLYLYTMEKKYSVVPHNPDEQQATHREPRAATREPADAVRANPPLALRTGQRMPNPGTPSPAAAPSKGKPSAQNPTATPAQSKGKSSAQNPTTTPAPSKGKSSVQNPSAHHAATPGPSGTPSKGKSAAAQAAGLPSSSHHHAAGGADASATTLKRKRGVFQKDRMWPLIIPCLAKLSVCSVFWASNSVLLILNSGAVILTFLQCST